MKRFFVYKYVLSNEIIYIGRTGDLYGRLNGHSHKGDNIPEEAWDDIKNAEIYYYEAANEKMADVIESELIRRHKPKYNKSKTTDWSGLPFPEPVWTKYERTQYRQHESLLRQTYYITYNELAAIDTIAYEDAKDKSVLVRELLDAALIERDPDIFKRTAERARVIQERRGYN